MLTTSGLSIIIHGVVSFPNDARSCDNKILSHGVRIFARSTCSNLRHHYQPESLRSRVTEYTEGNNRNPVL